MKNPPWPYLILFDDRVTGVFTFGSREFSHFTPERVGLLESVAYQLGPLLENAKLQYEQAVTDEVARIITSTLDIGDVYDQFAVAMKDLVNFDRASVVTIDTESGICTTRYVHGVDIPERRPGATRPFDGSRIQQAATSGVVVERADSSQRAWRGPMSEVYERLGLKPVYLSLWSTLGISWECSAYTAASPVRFQLASRRS